MPFPATTAIGCANDSPGKAFAGAFDVHDVVPMAEYFRLYHQIDVALDPFPFGGGTTTCDALWMGVPVVSLAGQTAVGRGGSASCRTLAWRI